MFQAPVKVHSKGAGVTGAEGTATGGRVRGPGHCTDSESECGARGGGGGIGRLEAEKWGVLQRSFWPLESIRAKSGNKEPAKRLTQAPSNRWRWPWWPGGWEEQRARRLC